MALALFVRGVGGECHPVEVPADATVAVLIAALPKELRGVGLRFGGAALEPETALLSDLGVSAQAEIAADSTPPFRWETAKKWRGNRVGVEKDGSLAWSKSGADDGTIVGREMVGARVRWRVRFSSRRPGNRYVSFGVVSGAREEALNDWRAGCQLGGSDFVCAYHTTGSTSTRFADKYQVDGPDVTELDQQGVVEFDLDVNARTLRVALNGTWQERADSYFSELPLGGLSLRPFVGFGSADWEASIEGPL